MQRKFDALIKDTLIFAVGSLGSKLILFLMVPLYTRFLTAAEYGTADLIHSFSQLVIPFSALAINEAVVRFGMKKQENKEDVLKASFVVLVFSGIAALIICYALHFYQSIGEWWRYLYVLVLLSNISEVEQNYLKTKNQNKQFAIMSILQTAVLSVSNVLLITVLHIGIQGYLLSNIFAVAVVDIAAFFAADIYADLRKGDLKSELLREMIWFSFPLVFSNVSWWIIHSSDKIMIERMITTSALGMYTAATKIPSLINVIIAIFNQAWGISSIREAESTNDYSYYVDVFKLFTTFLFLSAITIITIIKPFMMHYVGVEFREAWKYTPFLLSAAVFYSISAFIGSIYSAFHKSMNNMWSTLLCAAINVVINFTLIPVIGVWGAIAGTIVSYFVISIVRLIDVQRFSNSRFLCIRYYINVVLIMIQSFAVSSDFFGTWVSVAVIISFVVNNRENLKQFFLVLFRMISTIVKKNKQ